MAGTHPQRERKNSTPPPDEVSAARESAAASLPPSRASMNDGEKEGEWQREGWPEERRNGRKEREEEGG